MSRRRAPRGAAAARLQRAALGSRAGCASGEPASPAGGGDLPPAGPIAKPSADSAGDLPELRLASWRGISFCPFCGAALAQTPAAARSRGAEGRHRAVRRPRRLHRARGAARPGGRARAARALPRHSSLRAGALRRHGREVHRRRGDGAVRGAGRARGRPRAGRAGGARDPRLGCGAGRASSRCGSRSTPARRWSRSDARPERGRGDGRRRRGQHGRAPAGGRAGRTGSSSASTTYRATGGDRLPRGGAGRRQGEERADPGLGGARGAVARSASTSPAGGAPLVGRGRELELLVATLARVREERSPQLVTIVGVPGIGKSRLVARALPRRSTTTPSSSRWRQGRSLPYGEGVDLLGAGEIVKAAGGHPRERHAGAGRGEARPRRRPARCRRVGARTGSSGICARSPGSPSEEPTRRRAERRSPPGAASSRRSPRSGRSCSCSRICTGPTTRCSTSSTSWSSGRAACRCSCSRPLAPSSLQRRPGWGGGKPNALTISLSPLSDEDTAAPRPGAARAAAARRRTQEALLGRAGGNPLYAEQYARVLLERGDVSELPETVQGIIAARLDALSERREAAAAGRGRGREGLLAGRRRGGRRRRPDAGRGAAVRARAQGVRPALARLVGRGRERVRVPPPADPRHRLRPDPARSTLAEAPARGGLDRVARPPRGSGRDARPPLPAGARAGRGRRARLGGARRVGKARPTRCRRPGLVAVRGRGCRTSLRRRASAVAGGRSRAGPAALPPGRSRGESGWRRSRAAGGGTRRAACRRGRTQGRGGGDASFHGLLDARPPRARRRACRPGGSLDRRRTAESLHRLGPRAHGLAREHRRRQREGDRARVGGACSGGGAGLGRGCSAKRCPCSGCCGCTWAIGVGSRTSSAASRWPGTPGLSACCCAHTTRWPWRTRFSATSTPGMQPASKARVSPGRSALRLDARWFQGCWPIITTVAASGTRRCEWPTNTSSAIEAGSPHYNAFQDWVIRAQMRAARGDVRRGDARCGKRARRRASPCGPAGRVLRAARVRKHLFPRRGARPGRPARPRAHRGPGERPRRPVRRDQLPRLRGGSSSPRPRAGSCWLR